MGKLKLMTIIGTRPEIIRLSATIKCCDRYFEQILVHTGQNYDYTLNQVFFRRSWSPGTGLLSGCVGDDLGATIGEYHREVLQADGAGQADAVLVLATPTPAFL